MKVGEGGGLRSYGEDRQQIHKAMRQVGNSATGWDDHIEKHKYTQTEIPESLRARTITHCPPPPTQGRTSQWPQWVGQFRPRNTTHSPTPQNPLPPFLLLFCSAPSLCCFLSFLFIKLEYRTRREAACGKELSLLSFDDVISVVVPQQMFFL